jgi:peptidoglycan/xylan/chitin deacetylase (PgdA/CDA1 family)
MMRATALIYHDIVADSAADASGFQGADAAHYKLSPEVFEAHLDALVAARLVQKVGCLPLPSSDNPQGTGVFLTFDDGGKGAIVEAAPRLEKRGMRGVFFVTTDRIGDTAFLTEEDLRELDARGHFVGSHSATHPQRFSYLTPAEMDSEWRRSTERLARILGKPVRIASVPGGYYSEAVGQSAVRAGLDVLFNSEPGSRWQRVGTTWIAGRYSVTRANSPRDAAAFAADEWWLTTKQRVGWQSKKILKAVGGNAWLAARRYFFARSARR